MALPPAPAGLTRLLVKSKFGAGRDFAVLDPATKADIKAGSNQVVYQVQGTLLGIPKHMTITDASGAESPRCRPRRSPPIKDRMTLQVPSGTQTADVYVNVDQYDGLELVPGLLVLRIDAPCSSPTPIGSATPSNEMVKSNPEPVRAVVVDATAIAQTDTDGADIVIQIAGELGSQGSPWPSPT